MSTTHPVISTITRAFFASLSHWTGKYSLNFPSLAFFFRQPLLLETPYSVPTLLEPFHPRVVAAVVEVDGVEAKALKFFHTSSKPTTARARITNTTPESETKEAKAPGGGSCGAQTWGVTADPYSEAFYSHRKRYNTSNIALARDDDGGASQVTYFSHRGPTTSRDSVIRQVYLFAYQEELQTRRTQVGLNDSNETWAWLEIAHDVKQLKELPATYHHLVVSKKWIAMLIFTQRNKWSVVHTYAASLQELCSAFYTIHSKYRITWAEGTSSVPGPPAPMTSVSALVVQELETQDDTITSSSSAVCCAPTGRQELNQRQKILLKSLPSKEWKRGNLSNSTIERIEETTIKLVNTPSTVYTYLASGFGSSATWQGAGRPSRVIIMASRRLVKRRHIYICCNIGTALFPDNVVYKKSLNLHVTFMMPVHSHCKVQRSVDIQEELSRPTFFRLLAFAISILSLPTTLK
ncbi:hypothetical protein JOM56_005338 [Amanita muscaria]